ncbi:DUF2189 domain-containing protein [Aliikangiella sp. G2MR2-5]|uniref:DUF2189 domain-containing protein n=1 Tax=Aliikangiella sp. G2MR2-5 TaxID=2788943 RepID=UPI0018AB6A42|nr:DUF2189 domain-containing protein [Aliikangiella sp. G2MR2-5]
MAETAKRVDKHELPFVAPCNDLPLFSAVEWIKSGWKDFKSAPTISLYFGAFFTLLSYLLTYLSWQWGGAILLFSLLSGFVFMAPAMALGLYSVSHQINAGYKPKVAYCLREGKRHLGNEMIYSFVLLIIFLIWVRAGSALHIFFPMNTDSHISDFIAFFSIGSVVGSIFALIVFSASAFSLPMMLDRKADAITAVLTSVNAVKKNKMALMIWASTIVLSLLVCLITAYIAMLVIMPVIGYATWHGYKQTIQPDLWPKNKKLNDSNPGD